MAGQEKRRIRWAFLDRVGYAQAVATQERLRDRIKRGKTGDRLLFLEHPPVYTLGRNADGADILVSRRWLEGRGVEVVETDRGGGVTFHGPGQLVAYPILDLSPDRRDIRRYVQDLQRVLISTLADFGIEAVAREGQAWIGVWVGEAKIASIGVHLSRWVTTHGFALNVSTDLSFFSGIVPCGLDGVEMTSIERVAGEKIALRRVAEVCARRFGEVFGAEMRGPETAAALEGEPAWATSL